MPFHGFKMPVHDLDDIKDIGYFPLSPYQRDRLEQNLRDWLEQELLELELENLISEQYNISENEFINLLEGE